MDLHLSKTVSEWEITRLEDVAVIIMGQSPPGEHVIDRDSNLSNIGLPFLQGNAEFGNRYPNPHKWCIEPLKIAEPQDILISVRAPVGDLNLANQPVCIGRGLAAIRFVYMDASFGWHVVNWTRYWFERLTQGSTFKSIGRTEIKSLPIPFPPLSEQQKIAAILDSIDEAIQHTSAVLVALERLQDSILNELLKCRVKGKNQKQQDTLDVSSPEVVRANIADVNEWENTTVKEFAPFRYGKALKKSQRNQSGTCPVFGSNGIVGWHDAAIADGPTVIIGRKGSAGMVHYSPVPCWPIDTTFFVTGSDPILVRFIYYVLKMLKLEELNSDNAVPGLNRDVAHSQPLKIPVDISEQRAITTLLGQVDETIDCTTTQRDALRTFRQSISDALFTGRIRIPIGSVSVKNRAMK